VQQRAPLEWSFRLACPTPQQIRSASGLRLCADTRPQELGPLDLLLLPAMWRNPLPQVRRSAWVLPLIRHYAGVGTLICSAGTGSFFLAAAGVLDGRPAITHWRYMQQFARQYPQVELKPRHLLTQCDNIYCAGSVNSVADLMVHIVEQRFGSAISRSVANQFSPEIRQPFSATAFRARPHGAHHDEAILDLQAWLARNHARPGTPESWARQAQMSVRTLNRRFRAATGMTPVVYLNRLRMGVAQELLRHSNLSIGEVAWQAGYADFSYFCRQFRATASMSARAYRNMAKGKLFAPADAVPPSGPAA